MASAAPNNPSTKHKANFRVGLMAAAFALFMVGVGFAAVPLYRMFCQATGYNGTPQRVTEAQAALVTAKTGLGAGQMLIRFDANVDRGLPWQFKPEQPTQTIGLGGRHMAIFLAQNNSDHPITGRASFNIEPEETARYFNKIQCFCFTLQTLQPHQTVRMPVVYYVDPKIADDPQTKGEDEITLSYSFHKVAG